MIINQICGFFCADGAVHAEFVPVGVAPTPAKNALIIGASGAVRAGDTAPPCFLRIAVHLHDFPDSVFLRGVDEDTHHIFPAPQNVVCGSAYHNTRTFVRNHVDGLKRFDTALAVVEVFVAVETTAFVRAGPFKDADAAFLTTEEAANQCWQSGNGDQVQSSLQSTRKCINGADLPSAQNRFELGPHLFNEVEIRAVW